MTDKSAQLDRRIDLDWIRIAAFGSLILYHVGMVFVPWDYHVKSAHIVPALEPFMLVLNPWRLSLLFLIAGVATRFMMAGTAPVALLKQRSRRLLPPLLFGILVIVPPQSYWEVVTRHLYDGSPIAFYTGPYFSFAKEFCQDSRCIILPTWNHLWFVAYVWIYTVLLMLFVMIQPLLVERLETILVRVLSGIVLLIIPAFLFSFYRIVLFPRFPQTNALVGDWYDHALYFSMFAIGFFTARSRQIWTAMVRWRWVAIITAATVFAAYLLFWRPGASMPGRIQLYQHAAYGIYQWCCIVFVLGFGRHWITIDSVVRRYLTEAIFLYYIVHQTIILGVAFWLSDKGLSGGDEAAIIIVSTVAGCALSYEIVKRSAFLRPLFGLKSTTLQN